VGRATGPNGGGIRGPNVFEQLRAALAAAHGENLELRRQLGRQHRPPTA
jgi:hypothetical protein